MLRRNVCLHLHGAQPRKPQFTFSCEVDVVILEKKGKSIYIYNTVMITSVQYGCVWLRSRHPGGILIHPTVRSRM
jgi:hypothetical protein